VLVEKVWGAFFYRESHRRELAERACQRRVGCWNALVRKVWGIFLQGEPQEEISIRAWVYPNDVNLKKHVTNQNRATVVAEAH